MDARLATATDVQATRLAVTEGGFDVALLYINLNGAPSYLVADLLAEEGVPFIIATAYAGLVLPPRLQTVPRLRKPFEAEDLRWVLEELIG
ncbi:MAG: response regulator [Alphaproteobacteria bacterium]|nr:response regulator [Alphaproteobacteria bacterium]